jgi:acyl carrier protein
MHVADNLQGEIKVTITGNDITAIMKTVGIDPKTVDALKMDIPLVHQGLDSIDMPVIAVAVEKKFGIDLSEANATQLKTINDFVTFVNKMMPKG